MKLRGNNVVRWSGEAFGHASLASEPRTGWLISTTVPFAGEKPPEREEGVAMLIFKGIIQTKEKAGITPILNPPDLLERAKLHGVRFKKGAWGWAPNIWHGSAAGSVAISRDEGLKHEHKFPMMRTIEHISAQGPLIQVGWAKIGAEY